MPNFGLGIIIRSSCFLFRIDNVDRQAEPDNISANLHNYIAGFSESARDIFIDKFEIDKVIDRLDKSKLLYMVFCRFTEIDLHPDEVTNHEMGYVFEELIRRFSEQSNETAGEHFTPREVIQLMVNLLFSVDDELGKKGVIRTLYDPTAGTGGMLSVAYEYCISNKVENRMMGFSEMEKLVADKTQHENR